MKSVFQELITPYLQHPDPWLQEFLHKFDFVEMVRKARQTLKYRETHPDWERPMMLYGIRKKHKCIKKQEIAVIMDLSPHCDRARTAETHWYKIIHRRWATDLEWEEIRQKSPNRRYWIWSYYIEKDWTIDKIISQIIKDDREEYELETESLIQAFEQYFQRKIRIYYPESYRQLTLFP